MLFHLFFYLTFVLSTLTNIINNEEHLPFFVMQPYTIINQTLHSYCKEQFEFNTEPMFTNLTEWPSGFIYARNPQQKFDEDYESTFECTMELRAAAGEKIRLVFYPITNTRDDYDQDYILAMPKAPCLKIKDNDKTITFDCPMLMPQTKPTPFDRQPDDYLSNSSIIYLELLSPSKLISDYDDSYHQFKLFFTTFTRKLYVGLNNDQFICPGEHLLDCEDAYCVHSNARCNGVNECRSKIDEDFCPNLISRASDLSTTFIHLRSFVLFILLFKP